MESIAFDDYEPEPMRNTQPGDTIADCNEFRIRKESVSGSETLSFPDTSQPVLLNVVSGEIDIQGQERTRFKKGDTVLLPYTGDFEVFGVGEAELLITDHFA